MDIPESTQEAEQALIDAARHPAKGKLNRALRGRSRGQQFVAVVTVAAAATPVGAQAAGAQVAAGPSVVAARTVAAGHDSASTIVLTAAEQHAAPAAKITDAQWRKALMAAWASEYARNPSRYDWWHQAGDHDEGAQCAEAEAVVFRNAEAAVGVYWISNPRVPLAYHESKPWAIWRVDGDGSWKQWADQNPLHGRSRYHQWGDGQPQAGDLVVYGDPGYHITMSRGDGTVYGADDGSDLGNHIHSDSGAAGWIDMSLPPSLASAAPHANPPASQSNGSSASRQQQSGPQTSTSPQAAAEPSAGVAGGVAASGLDSGNAGTTLSTSATPVTAAAVVPGGIAPPGFVAGVGYADQFHASSLPQVAPKQAPKKSAKASPPVVRPYTRHNPPPATQARVPGSAAQQAFIRMVAPGAIAAQARYGVPASVTIAQAINESGWGQSGLAARDHNLFGIKGKGPAGSDMLPTQEYQNGAWVTITAPFRVYHNVAESIADHGALLHNGYYGRALAAWANNHNNAGANAFANALTGVYATSPSYGPDLIAIMQHFNLYQFNAMSASSGQASAPAQAAPPAARNGNPAPGAPPGSTGQPPAGNDAPGDIAVPGALAAGSAAAENPPQQAGGLAAAPGFSGPTVASQVTGNGQGADSGIHLTADVVKVPWFSPAPPAAAPVNPAPPAPAPAARMAPAVPVRATLTAQVEPVRARPAASQRPRTPTSVTLTDFRRPNSSEKEKYVKTFKAAAENKSNQVEWLGVSAATGLPCELVGVLALFGRPRGADRRSLPELVTLLIKQAWQYAGVNVTTGVMSCSDLDRAFRAYGVKREGGLTPSELVKLLQAPPGS